MADEKWLTYAEAGELLGLSPEAARQRARRKRWRTTKGNDGKARIMVPDDAAKPDNKQPGQPVGRTPGRGDGALQTLVEELAGARRRIDELTDRLAEALQSQVHDAAELAAAQTRETELRFQIDRLMDALQHARRPWWRRMFRTGT